MRARTPPAASHAASGQRGASMLGRCNDILGRVIADDSASASRPRVDAAAYVSSGEPAGRDGR